MNDYIKRADAMRPFLIGPDGCRIRDVDCDNFPIEVPIREIKKILRDIPPADVVEVIRCKDCKYAILEENLKICNHPSNNAWNITESHYCGYGKRKEDE